MNIEPQKLFVGLMDFFSILLPGALLTWLLMGDAGPAVFGSRYEHLSGAAGWAAFLFTSNLLGHLVFLLGSWLDEFYDWARRHTLNAQIRMAARRNRLLPWYARGLVWMVFKRERNLAVARAEKIKRKALGPLQAQDAVNTFQWSKALLTAESHASQAVVQRFEADSKFFRCFTIVLLLLLCAWPWQQQWPARGSLVVLGLLLLALWRYMEQRFKATNQAYWCVITLTGKAGTFPAENVAREAAAARAGGVVFRGQGDAIEYLLVEASDDSHWLVLPKGHVEEGEQDREAAVREVYEETGVWAHPEADLGCVTWQVKGKTVTTHFFLMRAIGRGLQQDKDRQHKWFTLDAAKKLTIERVGAGSGRVGPAVHFETHELLIRADGERHTGAGGNSGGGASNGSACI